MGQGYPSSAVRGDRSVGDFAGILGTGMASLSRSVDPAVVKQLHADRKARIMSFLTAEKLSASDQLDLTVLEATLKSDLAWQLATADVDAPAKVGPAIDKFLMAGGDNSPDNSRDNSPALRLYEFRRAVGYFVHLPREWRSLRSPEK